MGEIDVRAHSSPSYVALQHSANPAIVPSLQEKAIKTVSESWKTKFGSRRVKQALPTIEEALTAAECLSDEFEQQVEIAASLLGVAVEEVRAVAKRAVKPAERRLSLPIAQPRSATAAPRAVVVEYRAPKRLVGVR